MRVPEKREKGTGKLSEEIMTKKRKKSMTTKILYLAKAKEKLRDSPDKQKLRSVLLIGPPYDSY